MQIIVSDDIIHLVKPASCWCVAPTAITPNTAQRNKKRLDSVFSKCFESIADKQEGEGENEWAAFRRCLSKTFHFQRAPTFSRLCKLKLRTVWKLLVVSENGVMYSFSLLEGGWSENEFKMGKFHGQINSFQWNHRNQWIHSQGWSALAQMFSLWWT